MNEAGTALATPPLLYIYMYLHPHMTTPPLNFKSDSSSEKNACSVPKYSWDRVQPKDRVWNGWGAKEVLASECMKIHMPQEIYYYVGNNRLAASHFCSPDRATVDIC